MIHHSMACPFPEGCSCRASELNALERELVHVTSLYQSAEKECSELRDFTQWQNEKEIGRLRASLEDIATTAHCLAKAGPLSTPTLAAAWSQFMRLESLAVAALSKARSTNQPSPTSPCPTTLTTPSS